MREFWIYPRTADDLYELGSEITYLLDEISDGEVSVSAHEQRLTVYIPEQYVPRLIELVDEYDAEIESCDN